MKKILIFLLILSSNGTLIGNNQIPKSKNFEFKILRKAVQIKGQAVFSSSFIIEINDEKYKIPNTDEVFLEFLVDKLKEPKYFWSANLILHQIAEKDAVEIFAIFFNSDVNLQGYFTCKDEDLDIYSDYRKETIDMWEKWLLKQFP